MIMDDGLESMAPFLGGYEHQTIIHDHFGAIMPYMFIKTEIYKYFIIH